MLGFVIGKFAGSLIAVFLVSRIFWLAARRWPDSIGKAITLDLITGVLGSLLGAVGGADGGPPDMASFLFYMPAALVVLAIDLIRIRNRLP
jgi:hypothetical protein